MVYVTGEAAAEASGLPIPVIDELAATGEIQAKYMGWQLRVEVPVAPGLPEHPEGIPEPEPEPKRRTPTKSRSSSKTKD